MSTNSTTTPGARGRGRPRDAQLRRRILASAARLAADEGIDVGFDRIAQDAGASRTTLYRWWATPHELLLDALLTGASFSPESDPTHPAIERLHAHLENTAATLIDDVTGAPLRALAAVAVGREDARVAFVEHWLAPRRDSARALVVEAIGDGAIVDDDPDAIVDMLLSPIYHRSWLLRLPLTDDVIDALLRRVAP